MKPHQSPGSVSPGDEQEGGGDHSGDPAAVLASQIVAEEEDRALRKRIRTALNGDTLQAASDRLGVPYHTLRRIVCGRRPRMDILRTLCRVYLIDGHWLLTGEGTRAIDDRQPDTLRAAPTQALTAELTRRLQHAASQAASRSAETSLLRAQAALDALRHELDHPP